MDNQTEEKKEEGLRLEWVDVSLGFLWLVLGEAKLYQNLGDFTRIGDFTWRVSDCGELVGDKFLNRFITDYFT